MDTWKERYVAGIDKRSKITKSEVNVCGAKVPAEMDGGHKKKDMQSKYVKETKAAEKDHHWIRCRADKNDKLRYFEKLSIEEKKDVLVLSMYVEEVRVHTCCGREDKRQY